MTTPHKSFRIAPDLRQALCEEAEKQGQTESAIIRRALKAYLTKGKRPTHHG